MCLLSQRDSSGGKDAAGNLCVQPSKGSPKQGCTSRKAQGFSRSLDQRPQWLKRRGQGGRAAHGRQGQVKLICFALTSTQQGCCGRERGASLEGGLSSLNTALYRCRSRLQSTRRSSKMRPLVHDCSTHKAFKILTRMHVMRTGPGSYEDRWS